LHIAQVWENKIYIQLQLQYHYRRDCLGDLGVYWRIILKWISKKRCEWKDWIKVVQDESNDRLSWER